MISCESPVARETIETAAHPIAMASAFCQQSSRPFVQFSGHSLVSFLDLFLSLHASQALTSPSFVNGIP
jgi:hypothetical protein